MVNSCFLPRLMRRFRALSLPTALVLALMTTLAHREVAALPGIHPRAVSTWDTTRSTIVFDYAHGFLLEGGYYNHAGYNANFTSTSGRLSSQFGLHYINYRPDDFGHAAHGAAGSATAVYSFPLGQRFDNGLPRVALTFYGGGVPTAVLNGEYNYFTIPLVLGFGVSFSPIRHITITPWFELSPSLNVDTVIHPFVYEKDDTTLGDWGIKTEDEGDHISNIDMPDARVADIVNASVDLDISVTVRMRGGLALVANLGDRVDLQLNATVVQMGMKFSQKPAMLVGVGLAIAWDDPPPAVLPAAKRLDAENCTSVEKRFFTCPGYRALEARIREEVLAEQAEAAEAAAESAPEESPVSDEGPKPVSPPVSFSGGNDVAPAPVSPNLDAEAAPEANGDAQPTPPKSPDAPVAPEGPAPAPQAAAPAADAP